VFLRRISEKGESERRSRSYTRITLRSLALILVLSLGLALALGLIVVHSWFWVEVTPREAIVAKEALFGGFWAIRVEVGSRG
jgi:hypothetical protein